MKALHPRQPSVSGAAMVVALVVVALIGMGIASLGTIRSGFRVGGLLKARVTLENLAASGFTRARSELLKLVQKPMEVCPATPRACASKLPQLPDESAGEYWDYLAAIDKGYTTDNGKEFPLGERFKFDQQAERFQLRVTVQALPSNTQAATPPLEPYEGTEAFIVRSHVIDNTSGRSFVQEGLVSIHTENLARFSYGVINPTHPSPLGPFNLYSTNYKGLVYFGFHPTFKYGSVSAFTDPVIFREDSSVPFDIEGSFTGLDFQKGFTNRDLTEDFRQDTIVNDACTEPDYNWEAWSDGNLCLLLKDNVIEPHVCWPPNAAGYVNALSSYQDTMSGPSVTIPDEGLVICARGRTVGIKGIYSKPLTIVADNFNVWGDIVNRDGENAKYYLGLIAEHDLIIPMDVPVKNPVNPWWPNFQSTDSSVYSYYVFNPTFLWAGAWRWFGRTNFPVTWDFNNWSYGLPGYIDPDTGDTGYGSHHGTVTSWPACYDSSGNAISCPPKVGMAVYVNGPLTYGSVNYSSTLDIEAALLLFGKLNAENLNRFDINPKGFVVPACPRNTDNSPNVGHPDCGLYTTQKPPLSPPAPCITDLPDAATHPSIYKNRDCVGDINTADELWAEPIYCTGHNWENYLNYPGTIYSVSPDYPSDTRKIFDNPVTHTPQCHIGFEASRGTADQLWISGSLVTGDFGNINRRTYSGLAGFARKTVKYNPILMNYPPPKFPKAKSLFNADVRSVRKYFETTAAAMATPIP
ncbi:MAG: hypothetical protein V1798_02480 [Pseudomonadota bacterium]